MEKTDICEKKGPTKSTDFINVEMWISYDTKNGELLDAKAVEESLKSCFNLDAVRVKSIKHFTDE